MNSTRNCLLAIKSASVFLQASRPIRAKVSPQRNPFRLQLFSTSAQMSKEYVVIIPDKEDALERRLAVREKHLENVKKLFSEGVLVSGGVWLGGPVVAGTTPSFKGSVVNIAAESIEEVKQILSSDPYTTNDVWDWEKVQIYDFICAVRQAKP